MKKRSTFTGTSQKNIFLLQTSKHLATVFGQNVDILPRILWRVIFIYVHLTVPSKYLHMAEQPLKGKACFTIR